MNGHRHGRRSSASGVSRAVAVGSFGLFAFGALAYLRGFLALDPEIDRHHLLMREARHR